MENFAEELLRKNYGYKRILVELSNKGIEEDLIRTFNESYPYETEIERARSVVEDKVRKSGFLDTRGDKEKILNFLLRRGFERSIAKEAISSFN